MICQWKTDNNWHLTCIFENPTKMNVVTNLPVNRNIQHFFFWDIVLRMSLQSAILDLKPKYIHAVDTFWAY